MGLHLHGTASADLHQRHHFEEAVTLAAGRTVDVRPRGSGYEASTAGRVATAPTALGAVMTVMSMLTDRWEHAGKFSEDD